MNKYIKYILVSLITPYVINTYAQTKEVAEVPKMVPEMTEVWEPQPRVVTPGIGQEAPSDALVLFNGKDLSQWKTRNGEIPKWNITDNVLTVVKSGGSIYTKDDFRDFQLHIEWQTPAKVVGDGQHRSNSGIIMQGGYELQILDSYNNETYVNGMAGSLYKQVPPLVNAMKMPGEWNVYEVIYIAPRFKEDGALFSPARLTLLHNGVLVQNNSEYKGNSAYIGIPKYKAHGDGPIMLQDHGETISFRNIWIRKL
ncbi:3-keto-disaccharide hydrolase [Albibacterium bauzanense]|uniref:Uncharacterized protein DUF1080 n=1 Tax=Albibacterium bauzanense TaxID=653929 RepID=A0A4R1LTK1_9SPHI|nr:DUF1080 domain-containing protein [Albibacterium bauzanense]TCK80589.1 uncharacterized protein DUF1080 [Albibacterium bauzanense]